jgi:hypothetical protein
MFLKEKTETDAEALTDGRRQSVGRDSEISSSPAAKHGAIMPNSRRVPA